MDDVEVVLLLKYPLVLRTLRENEVVYQGSVHVNDEDYKICILESSNREFKLSLPEKLSHFDEEFDTLTSELQPKNIVTILDSLTSFIDSKIPSVKLTNRCDVYKHVLHEYSDFTGFYLNIKSCHLAHDLAKITVSTLDQRRREHSLEISTNFDDRDLFNVTFCDLPQEKEVFKKSSSLKEIYDQFLGFVEAFQPFFDVIDEFDQNCWVLDPEGPKRSCSYRRIWMGENFSVIITLNPADVSRLPEIKFLGPEKLVDEYCQRLNANIMEWEPENGIFTEILKLLGIEAFPQRPAVKERGPDLLVDVGDCSICFSARLNDKLPEVICRFCENYYHVECLYEWLMSVNARRFFSEVVGLCPNCEKNITCPIPK